jgi:hypothetical protein
MPANQTKAVKPETAVKPRWKLEPHRGLYLDVEMFANLSRTWGTYEQNVIKIERHRMICCFAWQFLDESKIGWLGLPSFPGYKRDPFNAKSLLRALHGLVSKASFLVGHNMKRYDHRRMNTDFIIAGLPPLPPIRTVCTLEFAKFKFDFNSNRLGDLCEVLGVQHKRDSGGYETWDRCEKGDPAAWKKMEYYNRGDVVSGKGVYLKMRPWMVRHPNMSLEDMVCTVCQSKRLIFRGSQTGHRGSFRYSCKDCGKWSSGKIIKGEWRMS